MQRETVWLVEDEQGIADTLVYMLQQEGFAVEVFERGLPVLDKARQLVPDVMILDVGLTPRSVRQGAHLTASGEEVLVAVSRHPYWSF